MTNRLVQIAVNKARQSACTYKVSAVGLNRRGEVIYTAMNRSRFMYKGGGVHAEMECMLKAGPGLRTIILCRVGGKGDILPIKPCETCQQKADELGIKIRTVL